HDARTQTERNLDRGRVHTADLAITADAAEYGDRVADITLHGPRQRRSRRVVRLQDEGAVTGGARLPARLERVDRPLAVGVGPEVTVQIGRAREVDAHRRGAYA